MSPDFNSLVLLPEDHEFIKDVLDDLTEENQLPFSLPPQSLIRLIKKSAAFFFRECDDSVQERWYVIKYGDIVRDGRLNAVV